MHNHYMWLLIVEVAEQEEWYPNSPGNSTEDFFDFQIPELMVMEIVEVMELLFAI